MNGESNWKLIECDCLCGGDTPMCLENNDGYHSEMGRK